LRPADAKNTATASPPIEDRVGCAGVLNVDEEAADTKKIMDDK
jgi:hypothetical protein